MKKPFEAIAKRLYSIFASVFFMLAVFVVPAFAADGDPLAVVNNLSDFIFSLIRAVGLILLGFGMAFIKSYAAICLEGCVILLACIIFSQFASSPPVVTEGLAPATVVWNYIGELVFNMLVLVGSIKMSDRIIRELMGLG